MSENQSQSSDPTYDPLNQPWRFRGPNGPVIIHPDAVLCSIQSNIIYDQGTSPPKHLGEGCVLAFALPSVFEATKSGTFVNVIVLVTSEEIERQILARGGWGRSVHPEAKIVIGPLEERERCAKICETMIVGGRAWTEEQSVAGKVLLEAAENIRNPDLALIEGRIVNNKTTVPS